MKEYLRNEWVTVPEAAIRMDTNQARIRQWIARDKDGKLEKRGNRYLYRQLEEIDARTRHEKQRSPV